MYKFWDLLGQEDIKENLINLVGFFVIQQHLSHFWPELYSDNNNKFLVSQSNSLLEVSITEYAKQSTYYDLLNLKEQVLAYVIGMKELGYIK